MIKERAESPEFAIVPGGKTGLLCKDITVSKVDTGPLAEMRAYEQQATQELSQWQTRSVVEKCKVIDATPAAKLAMCERPSKIVVVVALVVHPVESVASRTQFPQVVRTDSNGHDANRRPLRESTEGTPSPRLSEVHRNLRGQSAMFAFAS